jgi:hypothetical protein
MGRERVKRGASLARRMLKELEGEDRAVEVEKPGLQGEMERLKGREAATGTGTVGDYR